jgi:drug/metabolite transporter (DMT)-like permease
MKNQRTLSTLQVLLAAVLFGASAPLAKLLLGDIQPVMLAGLLYLGSGIGLGLLHLATRVKTKPDAVEARLKGKDYAWLTGAVLAGGIAAPILLLVSLQKTPASTASLLLNFEAVATAVIAWLIFREAIGRRALLAILLITVAGILLSLDTSGSWGFSLGALGILTACLFWGLDNNFTRNISSKDPVVITLVKGLAGGTFSILLALLLGNSLPGAGKLLAALALGSLSYGASIVLFIRAMRGMGAARTSALFNISPLVGVILSIVLLSDMPGWMFFVTIPILATGAVLLMTESHTHAHLHWAVTHEHAHNHSDGHHTHSHDGVVSGSHSHLHEHEEVTHAHVHLPDTHHRHAH